jgi:hypothetical protein
VIRTKSNNGKALLRYWPLADAQFISHDPEYNNVPPNSSYRPTSPEAIDTDEEQ